MSDTTPEPANVPITIRGNHFYRNDDRFLIKGISYHIRTPRTHRLADGCDSIDPLSNGRLEGLRRDIALVQELGLNCISVSGLNSRNDHSAALKLLEDFGIYVFVHVAENLRSPAWEGNNLKQGVDPGYDPAALYDLEWLKNTLHLIENLAGHPNVLAVAVNANIQVYPDTKLAELIRAYIRDIKAFVQRRNSRPIPIGVTTSDLLFLRAHMLRYFSAGEPSERADFFAHDCWSWAGKSSFQVSGWKNMVGHHEAISPIPMLFSAYGTNITKPRVWDEVLCLYSPDMTGVYSGGSAWTFFEYSTSKYGLVEARESGERVTREQEFNALKNRMRKVNSRTAETVATTEAKDYENWRGEFPQRDQRWNATASIPTFPGDWEVIMQEAGEEKDWEIISASVASDTGLN
jgi:hypothetical protein